MIYLGPQPGPSGSAWDSTMEGTQNFDYPGHGEMAQDPEDSGSSAFAAGSGLEDYSQQQQQQQQQQQPQPYWSLGSPAMQRTLSRSSADSFDLHNNHHQRSVRSTSTNQRARPRIQTNTDTSASMVAATTAFGYGGNSSAASGLTDDAFPTASVLMSPMSAGAAYDTFTGGATATSQLLQQQQQYLTSFYPNELVPNAYTTGGLTTSGLASAYPGDFGSVLEASVATLTQQKMQQQLQYLQQQQQQQHVDPTEVVHMHYVDSPLMLGSHSSRRSSPELQDTWSNPPAGTSPAESHDSIMSYPPLSVSDDTAVNNSLAGDFGSSVSLHASPVQTQAETASSGKAQQRSGSDSDTVRGHRLYKEANPDGSGLYHCPWEGQSTCNHKPEKLKCNYDKYVDSHLKPYRCKNPLCENTRFSSTACLLRHEREAHAMHGHGDKPYLCSFDGCERSTPGNGFPRQWNLKDHMRRVHHDEGPATPAASAAMVAAVSSLPSPPRTAAAAPSGAQALTKGRKRKKEGSSAASHHHPSSARKTALSSPSTATGRISKSQQRLQLQQQQQAEMQAAAARAQLEQSLKLWGDSKSALMDVIQSLGQPFDTQTSQQIRDAFTHLDILQQIPHSIVLPQTNGAAYGHAQQSG